MKCDGKIVYGKVAAQRAATKASRESGGDYICPYYCSRHSGWHIGHPPLLRGASRRDRVD